MTVPAKDANSNTFMFGLVHDYAHPPSTRTTAKFTIAATAPKTRSKSSHAQSMNGAAKLIPMGQPQPQPKREPLGNGAAPRTRRPRTRRPSMSKTNGGVPENRAVVDWEIPRKTLHASIGAWHLALDCPSPIAQMPLRHPPRQGFLTIYLYTSQGEPRTIIYTLSTALAIIVPADVIRLRRPRFEAFYERCLGFLMRESEKACNSNNIQSSSASPLMVATPSPFAEKQQRRYLVPPRDNLRPRPLPNRHRHRIHSHVRPSSPPSPPI
jgi:diacylglycerol kinase (CTP)